jgi:OmpA-OmpF porin, OOP family
MATLRNLFTGMLLFAAAFAVHAADVAGAMDHPLVSRYAGSEILKYEAKEFDRYTVPTGPSESSQRGPKSSSAFEGRITRLHYRAPADRTALEVFRNYEQSLRNGGFTVIHSCQDKPCGREFSYALGVPFVMHHAERDQKYLAARLTRPEGEVVVVLYTIAAYGVGGVNKNRVFTQLDIIEVKAMQAGQVQVDAAAMAGEIAARGRVALYGIYFDTNRTEVKPESKPALDEIGRLLKQNPALNLLVVGHTDSAGDYAYNLDLSRKRAESVVQILTGQHGIAPARLRAAGVGYAAPVATNRAEDGRAKNRRVELVEAP